jgi:hypothetical protein
MPSAAIMEQEPDEPRRRGKAWTNRATPQEFLDYAQLETRKLIQDTLKELRDKLHKIPASSLPVTYGILVSKLTEMSGGQGPSVVHNTQININGVDRESMAAMLEGRQNLPSGATASRAHPKKPIPDRGGRDSPPIDV